MIDDDSGKSRVSQLRAAHQSGKAREGAFLRRRRMAAILLPEIDTDTCTGCGDCVAVCPTGALAMVEGKAVMAHPDLCIYDGECEPVCIVGAIQIPYMIVLA